MLTTIAKRIQSRLSRQGIKVSLGEVKEQCDRLIADIDNATEEELTKVAEYFISSASQLTVVEEHPQSVATEVEGNTGMVTPGEEQPQPVATPHEEPAQSELVHNLYTSVYTTPQTEETETSICAGGELGNIATPAQIEPETLEIPEDVGAIAPVATSELVANTAESMGISLNLQDIENIASNFDHASQDSDDELEEIKSAITAFVQHKAALSRQKIQHIVQEVKQTIHNLDAENSQHLNDGLRSISQDIKSGSERFRQQTRQALKVFALPPSKAG
ncbi:hypothetical protein [Nodularia spumigena]|uniref:hypothetical protein n=1 Tax=Nodularia spumigena TaxID=70799 RepID=UPI002B1EDFF9|nr:hypothetical protein [Nodularia spumigena]MEA5559350.1 hypothetical protein [Nodularia spumigena CH309]